MYIYALSKFFAARFTRHIYVKCCLTITFKEATIKSFFTKSMIALFMLSQALGLIKVCNLFYYESWIKRIILSFWLWFEFIVRLSIFQYVYWKFFSISILFLLSALTFSIKYFFFFPIDLDVLYVNQGINLCQEFPGSPMVRTPWLPCSEKGSILGCRTKILQTMRFASPLQKTTICQSFVSFLFFYGFFILYRF